MRMENENSFRRAALHLAAQLPDDPDDAMKVINYLAEIAELFLFERLPGDADNCVSISARRRTVSKLREAT